MITKYTIKIAMKIKLYIYVSETNVTHFSIQSENDQSINSKKHEKKLSYI